MSRWWMGLVLTCLAGCALGKKPVRVIDRADAAFAAGDDAAAAEAYLAAKEAVERSDEAERAELFALLARRAAARPEELDQVLADLRAFSIRTPPSVWTRAAGLVADEMAQVDVLRWTLQRSGAERAQLEQRIASLEEELARARQENEALNTALQGLKDERGQLQRRQRELEDRLQESSARIAELEAELEALKSIDMSRTP